MITPNFLNLPEDIYIDDDQLKVIVEYGIENFCLPDEALIECGYSGRFYKYWILLAKSGDQRAQRILDYLDSIPKKWIRQTRKRVLKSNDMKAVSTYNLYMEDMIQQKTETETELTFNDEWI